MGAVQEARVIGWWCLSPPVLEPVPVAPAQAQVDSLSRLWGEGSLSLLDDSACNKRQTAASTRTLVLPYSVACPSIMLPPLEGACPPVGLCASAASSSRHAAASPSPRLGILVGRLSLGLSVSPKASLGGLGLWTDSILVWGPGPACGNTRAMFLICQASNSGRIAARQAKPPTACLDPETPCRRSTRV